MTLRADSRRRGGDVRGWGHAGIERHGWSGDGHDRRRDDVADPEQRFGRRRSLRRHAQFQHGVGRLPRHAQPHQRTLTSTDPITVSGTTTWKSSSTLSGSGTFISDGNLNITPAPNVGSVTLSGKTLENFGRRRSPV